MDKPAKPANLLIAIKLLYFLAFLGLLDCFIWQITKVHGISTSRVVLARIMDAGIVLLASHLLGAGKNWPRLLLLFVLGISRIFFPFSVRTLLATSGLLGSIEMVIFIIGIVVLCFLYSTSCRQWFVEVNKMSDQT